jgi:hypothetical protein
MYKVKYFEKVVDMELCRIKSLLARDHTKYFDKNGS